MQLKDKTALIPGASRAVGRAIARKFGEQGACLVLPVFDWPESIDEMVQEFQTSGFNFEYFEADLRKKEDVLSLVELVKDRGDRLDYLINNIERGGMPVVHGSYDLPHNTDQWEIEIDTTLKAKWLLFHHCLPLLKNSEAGSVLNITSIASEIGRSGSAACFFNDGYSAANMAVRSFTKTWAREAAPSTRVNELCLGLIQDRHGENTRGWVTLDDDHKREIFDEILLGRTGFPAEVAQCAYFLAVQATYITGSVIKMDGGLSLGSRKVPPMPPGIL